MYVDEYTTIKYSSYILKEFSRFIIGLYYNWTHNQELEGGDSHNDTSSPIPYSSIGSINGDNVSLVELYH